MLPAIRPGDLVWVERAVPDEVSVGEIVAFAREGRLIVHRVAAIGGSGPEEVRDEQTCLVTRGDRLQQDDVPISATELIGRVTHIERCGTKFLSRQGSAGCSWQLVRCCVFPTARRAFTFASSRCNQTVLA